MREKVAVFSIRWLPSIVAGIALLGNVLWVGKVFGEISTRITTIEKRATEMTVELTDLSFEKQLARFVSRSEWSESVRENRDSHLAIIKALDINTAETKAALLRIEEKLDRLQDKR